MKHSEKTNGIIARILILLTFLFLLVPNVALSIMGDFSVLAACANILLPAGLLLFLLTWRDRPGLNVLLLLPFMILAAFQIVLLFLYADGSIIGVDMFLNVATTNPSEAGELLNNLGPAIATVVALYLPVIVLAIVAIVRKVRTSGRSLSRFRTGAMILSVSGAIVLAACMLEEPYYSVDEDLYPVNVLANLSTAVNRSYAGRDYYASSSDATYHARSTRPDNLREIYVAVVGETSRTDNWQFFGYERYTTPRLCSLPAGTVTGFGKTLSESNTTHKAVPLLLSNLTADDFDSKINRSKSVITAFKEAGFTTAFISMQCRNHSYIDYFGEEADTTMFLREPTDGVIVNGLYDKDMLASLDSVLAGEPTKLLVVLHQYGSHFNYLDRYPREEAYFLPDKTADAGAANRGQLVNAYDNSIRHTDNLLYEVIHRLDSINCVGGMIYASDHGEDIYDDARGRFLHASPTPTYFQLHVPMLVYLTPCLQHRDPSLLNQARLHQQSNVSSSQSYTPTLLNMAGIVSPDVDRTKALTSARYTEPEERLFLSDRNKAYNLMKAGFKHEDYDRLERLNI
ncbi:MAG: lipid A phosphoethanolamine transferase [Bacteroides sp.]|nr:lipid A phosphoethanolamine transferase [Bacteroides sp.]